MTASFRVHRRSMAAGLVLLVTFGCRTDLEQNYTETVFDCEAGIARIESCCDVEVEADGVCVQTEGTGGSGCTPTDYSRRVPALSQVDAACLADAGCDALRSAGLCASAPPYLATLAECDGENTDCPESDAGADPEAEQDVVARFRNDMGVLCK